MAVYQDVGAVPELVVGRLVDHRLLLLLLVRLRVLGLAGHAFLVVNRMGVLRVVRARIVWILVHADVRRRGVVAWEVHLGTRVYRHTACNRLVMLIVIIMLLLLLLLLLLPPMVGHGAGILYRYLLIDHIPLIALVHLAWLQILLVGALLNIILSLQWPLEIERPFHLRLLEAHVLVGHVLVQVLLDEPLGGWHVHELGLAVFVLSLVSGFAADVGGDLFDILLEGVKAIRIFPRSRLFDGLLARRHF